MASQTVMTLCSSFTPKLVTINSPTPALLPLPPRSFSCSSSLPTPCLKASFGGRGIRVLQTPRDFRCYASPPDGVKEILKMDDPKVNTLGKYAVEEYNKKYGARCQFQSVQRCNREEEARVIEYNFMIEVTVDGEKKLIEAKSSFGPYIA